MTLELRHFFLLLLIAFSAHAFAITRSESVAFYYGAPLPLAEMSLYSKVVVQPDQANTQELHWLKQHHIQVYAYLSVGESDDKQHQGLLKNNEWDSQVMDLTSTQWQKTLLQRAKGLKSAGYSGLFLDTLDSYQLTKPVQQPAQRHALLGIIKQLSSLFSHRLILNRGFPLLPQLVGQAEYVVAEGLYSHYQPKGNRYNQQTSIADQQWLTDQLNTAKKLGFQTQVIDYAKPENRFAMAQKILKAGFLPWVTDGHLQTWGTSDLNPVARKIIIPFNHQQTYLIHSDVHTRLASFIEYLGYIPVYIDLSQQALPDPDPAIYAGVISWTQSPAMYSSDYVQWLLKAKHALPVMVLGQLPDSAPLLAAFGVKMLPETPPGPYQTHRIKPWLVGESALKGLHDPFALTLTEHSTAQPLISVTAADGSELIQGVRSGNDVLIASPWLIENLSKDDSRWMVNPYQLLHRAFALPNIPVPDVTTESGRRRLLTYIDGDAFPSLARFPGQPIAAKVIEDQIIKPYRLPITVSVIEGEVGPKGMYPKRSPYLEKIAREIFALPYVDMGSHTFSHPFFWDVLAGRKKFTYPQVWKTLAGKAKEVQGEDSPYGFNLPVPNYKKVILKREIEGSIDYINRRLAPKGKKVAVLLWSGDALPGAKPIRLTQQAGVLNVNGGDTYSTNDNPTLSSIAPLARPEGELLYQIYAPMMNEELYTNNWHGPYDGFKRLIETFKLTEKPYRLKPFTVYYHFFSGTNPAGVHALKTVLDYALSQPNTPIQLARYARSAQDFYFSALARDSHHRWVFSSQFISTLRLPTELGWADLQHSQGLAGMTSDGRYLHLPSGHARFATQDKTKANTTKPYLVSANVVLNHWSDSHVAFFSWLKAQLVMANAEQCQFKSTHGHVYTGIKHGQYRLFSLPQGRFQGTFTCHNHR